MDNGRLPNHLRRLRYSDQDKLREFSYARTIVPALDKRNAKRLRYAWAVSYNSSYIITLPTLKEVKEFIQRKVNT